MTRMVKRSPVSPFQIRGHLTVTGLRLHRAEELTMTFSYIKSIEIDRFVITIACHGE